MKKIIFLFVLVFAANLFSQELNDSTNVELFIIDSYIAPEKPYKLILSFSTSDSCTSVVKINKLRNIIAANELTDIHKVEVELTKEELSANVITYQIILTLKDKSKIVSEDYFVELPQETIIKEVNDFNYTQMCIGGLVFAIPTLEYAFIDGKEYLGLSKEIPLYNFYGKGYNYPQGFISLEFSHYLKAARINFLRFGYKHIFQLSQIKYVSPGVSFFGDFKGYNGISVETSLGLFQIKNMFTLFTRYRYNFQLKNGGKDFYEFSIGLYANFFSLNF